jgi:hypothetical protein
MRMLVFASSTPPLSSTSAFRIYTKTYIIQRDKIINQKLFLRKEEIQLAARNYSISICHHRIVPHREIRFRSAISDVEHVQVPFRRSLLLGTIYVSSLKYEPMSSVATAGISLFPAKSVQIILEYLRRVDARTSTIFLMPDVTQS